MAECFGRVTRNSWEGAWLSALGERLEFLGRCVAECS